MNNTSSSSLSDLPAVRLASGVEPQQKWQPVVSTGHIQPVSLGSKQEDSVPKLVEISPKQGQEGTIITVVVQSLPPQIPVKLAFNNLLVDTKQMQAYGITSLVATVPSFQHIHSSSYTVPVSICVLDRDMVTETWLVSNFLYTTISSDSKNETLPFNNNISSQTKGDNHNDFLNSSTSAAAYQSIYSSSASAVNLSYNNNGFGAQQQQYQQYPSYQEQQRRDIIGYNKYSNSQQNSQQYSNGYVFPPSSATSTSTSTASGGFSSMYARPVCQTNSSAMMPTSYTQPQLTTAATIAIRRAANATGRDGVGAVYGFKSASLTPTISVESYQPYPGLISRANLDISGDLDSMTKNWSSDEYEARRRLVQFLREQDGNKIKCSFRPLPAGEEATNIGNIVVSCIYWMERDEYFITSVDCIYLLECLMDVKFSVEEKNRIRRNLEGFRPLTVSKCKAESAEFFKLIMGFPNPKPRNIEKDVKAFPWKTLPYALKKIVTKYTASTYDNAIKQEEKKAVPSSLVGQGTTATAASTGVEPPTQPTAAAPNTSNSSRFYKQKEQTSSYAQDLYDDQQEFWRQNQQPQSNNNNNNSNEASSSHPMLQTLNDIMQQHIHPMTSAEGASSTNITMKSGGSSTDTAPLTAKQQQQP